MAVSLTDLQAWLDALIKARSAGVRSVSHGDTRTEFKTDAEMAAAIADLEQRIAAVQGVSSKRGTVAVYASGLTGFRR